MPSNIEIKLRVTDRAAIAARVLHLPDVRDAGQFEQIDIFFQARQGRLKLRLTPGKPAQLIHYQRADAATLRRSTYTIIETPDGEALRAVLETELGELGRVRKHRHLFLLDNVRIHLDEVNDLGTFIELEAVVDPTHDEPTCQAQAQKLLRSLGLDTQPAEPRAYIDLLQSPDR